MMDICVNYNCSAFDHIYDGYVPLELALDALEEESRFAMHRSGVFSRADRLLWQLEPKIQLLPESTISRLRMIAASTVWPCHGRNNPADVYYFLYGKTPLSRKGRQPSIYELVRGSQHTTGRKLRGFRD